MTDYILAVGVGAFIVYTVFNIVYLMTMKRTSDRVNEFVRNTEGNLNTTLQELAGTLENLRRISGNVSAVSDDVRQISHSVASLERSMRESLVYLKESLGSAAEANIAGLRAGITTGVATLVKNLHEGRREEHERGTGED
jgi:ABC-type transporter Mla subunit MlaD